MSVDLHKLPFVVPPKQPEVVRVGPPGHEMQIERLGRFTEQEEAYYTRIVGEFQIKNSPLRGIVPAEGMPEPAVMTGYFQEVYSVFFGEKKADELSQEAAEFFVSSQLAQGWYEDYLGYLTNKFLPYVQLALASTVLRFRCSQPEITPDDVAAFGALHDDLPNFLIKFAADERMQRPWINELPATEQSKGD